MTDFPYAAMIEESLQRVAERCEDQTPLVYGRLFKAYPDSGRAERAIEKIVAAP